jgi:fumarylpyruvate hydrolase
MVLLMFNRFLALHMPAKANCCRARKPRPAVGKLPIIGRRHAAAARGASGWLARAMMQAPFLPPGRPKAKSGPLRGQWTTRSGETWGIFCRRAARPSGGGFFPEAIAVSESFVFDPPAVASVAVDGSAQRFPVARVFCVGRNYAAHAREMGADTREPPFYFNKSALHVVDSGATLPYATETQNLHHEVELVVAIGRPAFRIAPEDALSVVWGYGCGLDMTRRDLQDAAKQARRPWDTSKDFEGAAVISPIAPVARTGHPAQGAITLSVNEQLRQSGDLADQIWTVPEVIANLSRLYHLMPGDLIMTGTPEGVGAVQAGDVLDGEIAGVGRIRLTLAPGE